MVQENCLTCGAKDKVVVVCGATASGKTSLAVKIARKFGGEVVSADSVSIYRGLDIGSAKPSDEEKQGIPHYMIDIVSPKENFSVGDYRERALPIVRDIVKRGKIPVICGGTGFYINSVLYNMSYGNAKGDSAIRLKYERLAEEQGKDAVYSVLKEKDPETAERLHPNDLVRVIRALEIFDGTGVKKSDIKDEMVPNFSFLALMPDMPRETLYDRINRRVDVMIEQGLKAEVEGLMAEGVTPADQCMQGIGYKETIEALLNGEDIPAEIIKMNTRRYAKRQITFFKRLDGLQKIDTTKDDYLENVYKIVDNFLNN